MTNVKSRAVVLSIITYCLYDVIIIILILPGRKFVQVSRGDRYGHLYLELDVSTTFGHGVVVATML